MQTRKVPNEGEVRKWLEDRRLALPPLRFTLRKVQPAYAASRSWDFELEARWDDQTAVFAVEYKARFTPRAFEQALSHCRVAMLPADRHPLLMLPYLRPSQLEELESYRISGVDWCGNGVVIVPDRFRVFRSGGPNQFATGAPIKNIYRKNTSMVARVLLAASPFSSVGEVLAEVKRRDVLAETTGRTPVTMGTVSKALKQLEDDLIVERRPSIRLLQADKLLDQLQQNYEPPRAKPVRLKIECGFEQLPQFLSTKIEKQAAPVVGTGLSSAARYATMQREDILSFYCPDAKRVQALLGGRVADRFPNVELIETVEQPLYFDARPQDGFYWASPVQTWLELTQGDKRDREAADQVRAYILRAVQGDT